MLGHVVVLHTFNSIIRLAVAGRSLILGPARSIASSRTAKIAQRSPVLKTKQKGNLGQKIGDTSDYSINHNTLVAG